VALSEFRETKYPSEQSPVDIVYEDESVLVVDKPSTLPIHPCGCQKVYAGWRFYGLLQFSLFEYENDTVVFIEW
jgi:hypothetical protein